MADDSSDLLRASRRVTTVLIADLVGSSALAEEIDPEDLDRILKRLIEGARRIAADRYGGTTFGSDGDDIKALFGDPIAHEDDPCRAVRCASDLHAFARDIAGEFPELGGRPLQLHSAIATGLVIAKSAGHGLFGPTGDAINTAARLVHMAGPGEIVVDAATQQSIATEFETASLGSRQLKGKRDPVEIFGVVRPISRQWFEVARVRGLSPFVGRESALAVVEDALADARAGRGRFLTVSGEPGIGKSRLLYEVRQRLDDGFRVALAECDAAPTVAPFHAFRGVLRELLGIVPTESPAGRRARVTSALDELDPSLSEYFPLYLELLSIRTDDIPMPVHLHDEWLARAIREAIARLVAAAARRGPLALLLEDWHRADEASRGVLARVLDELPAHAMLVVVTYRSEWQPRWSGHPPVDIRLGPLDAADARTVIASCLRVDSVSSTLVNHFHHHTGGNPLFLDEICRSLRDAGFRPSATTGTEGIVVPATVQAVIRARIDRLPPRLRRLVHLASVFGLFFSRDLLARLAEENDAEVAGMLEELHRLDLVRSEVEPDPVAARHRFRHVLIRDVAYDMLLHEDRRRLHRRAGTIFEALDGDEPAHEHDEVIADHYERGGDVARAAHFARRAGDKAFTTFSLRAARDWYRRTITLLDMLGDGADAVRERVDVSGRWAEVCVYDPAAAEDSVLHRSYELAEASGDRRRAARAVYWLGWFEHARGDHHAAARHYERAFELVDRAKDGRLVPQLQTNLGQTAYHRGELDLAVRRLEPVIATGARSIVTANALGYLALVYAEQGRFTLANECIEHALGIVIELQQRQLHGSLLTIAAYVAMFQGRWERCLQRAVEMRQIAMTIDAPYILAMSKTADGYARWFLFTQPDAFVSMRDAIDEIESGASKLSMSVNYACLAEVMALAGQADEARVLAERALGRAATGDRVGEIQAWRALGIADARVTPPRIEPARACFERGIALALDRGSIREAATTRWRLAEGLAAAGRCDEALELLDDAVSAFERCEMEWHAAEARALAGGISRKRGQAPFSHE